MTELEKWFEAVTDLVAKFHPTAFKEINLDEAKRQLITIEGTEDVPDERS